MLTGSSRHAQLERAHRLFGAGTCDQAAELCRQIIRQNPADLAAHRLLSAAQAGLGDFAGARATIDKALRIRPADVELLGDSARTYLNEGRLPEALKGAERALRLAPDHAGLIGLKSHIQVLGGDQAGAWETIRAAVDSGDPDPGLATTLARVARRVGQEDRAAALLGACLASPSLAPLLRAELLFRLGDLRDAQGDWDAAFGAYSQANAIRRGLYRYEVRDTTAAVDELIARWRPGIPWPRAPVKTDRPVFIIGMPRSGTSLVEQVLASHPSVFPGGELDDFTRIAHEWQGAFAGSVAVFTRVTELTPARLDSAAKAYAEHLRRLDPRALRLTDKMPVNYLHLGLISLIIPGGRAVHCTRDPMDTCLSCYFQNFSGALPYAYDLRDLGLFFRAYSRLMKHWEQVLEFPMLTVPYEDMVKDHEGVTRRLVEFAALPWDDRCLKFYETKRVVMTSSNDQVRRPVYSSSIGRWKHYEKHLGPLVEALGS